jgi:hypothetical protein
VTLNPTGHWVWITIYDVGERQQLDWGWLGRTACASGTPAERRRRSRTCAEASTTSATR